MSVIFCVVISGEETAGSGPNSFLASLQRARGSAAHDDTAGKCLNSVRLQLNELQAQQQVIAAEVAAERQAEHHLQDLSNNVLRLKFEVDYARRTDAMPDAPKAEEREMLVEKEKQLSEAQAALQVWSGWGEWLGLSFTWIYGLRFSISWFCTDPCASTWFLAKGQTLSMN